MAEEKYEALERIVAREAQERRFTIGALERAVDAAYGVPGYAIAVAQEWEKATEEKSSREDRAWLWSELLSSIGNAVVEREGARE